MDSQILQLDKELHTNIQNMYHFVLFINIMHHCVFDIPIIAGIILAACNSDHKNLIRT